MLTIDRAHSLLTLSSTRISIYFSRRIVVPSACCLLRCTLLPVEILNYLCLQYYERMLMRKSPYAVRLISGLSLTVYRRYICRVNTN